MKLIERRFILVLIMLWLPLQGAFAAAMPLCTHEENTGNTLNVVVIPIIDDHLHTIRHEQPMDDNITFNLHEVNTLCHASCSTMIPPALSTAIPTGSSSYTVSLVSNSTSFIPEQFQRPPLA
jgi:hypothetical protein